MACSSATSKPLILHLTIFKDQLQPNLTSTFISLAPFNGWLLFYDSTCLHIKNYFNYYIHFLSQLYCGLSLSSSTDLLFDFFKELSMYLETKETLEAYFWEFTKLKGYIFQVQVVPENCRIQREYRVGTPYCYWLEIFKERNHSSN